MGNNGFCKKCNESYHGDGYRKVLHCPNASEEKIELAEPDANPIDCDFEEYAEKS